MKLHKLTFANLDQPRLSADDPDATVWIGGETKPDIIAKRVGDWCWFRIDELATYRFPPTSPDLSVTCVADPCDERSHRTVVDAYYRSVVPLALQVYGLEAMHGTAVETAAGTVALCGHSHAGKTTLTYALSRRGHTVLADDGLVIDPAGPGGRVAVQPIPFALMIREFSAEHFGTQIRAKVAVSDDAAPTVTVTPVPLAAVVRLSRQGDAELDLARHSPTEAFRVLLDHCYVFSLEDVGRKGKMMAAYLRFANTVPVYTLTYPDGLEHLDEAAAAIERLMAGLPTQAVNTSP